MAKPFSRREIEQFFARLSAANPSPRTELEYTNPFTLLVAVVLSAQATDRGVNRATAELFKIAETPEKLLRLGETGLLEHIRSIGLYRTKAKTWSRSPGSSSPTMAAGSRPTGTRSRRCRAWGARRRTWF